LSEAELELKQLGQWTEGAVDAGSKVRREKREMARKPVVEIDE